MKVVLIDADSLFYAICFGKFNQFNKKEKSNYDIRDYYNHLDSWIKDIFKKTGASHYLAFWTNGKVFRHNIDPNYKSGRPEDKPLFFDDVRRYFVSKWKGIHVKGLEAEDLVAVYSTHYKNSNINYCVARIDHDLDQLEGEHYNFKEDKLYSINKEEANYNLYKQVLTGCQTDKVIGLKGVGDKKAIKILSTIEKSSDYNDYTVGLHFKVLATYIKHEGWEIGRERYTEVFDLVYLLRYINQIKQYTNIDYTLQDPYICEEEIIIPKMFNNDLPDFLK